MNSPRQTASGNHRSRVDRVLDYLIPIIPLLILMALFAGIVLFAEHVLEIELPSAAKSLIFIILLFFACAVYITRILREYTSIAVNGWTLTGVLAIIFVLAYFVTTQTPSLMEIFGFKRPAIEFSKAEVELRCNRNKLSPVETEKFYALAVGNAFYIDHAEEILGFKTNSRIDGNIDIVADEILSTNHYYYDYFYNFLSDQNWPSSFLAYSVPARTKVIPVPIRLNDDHSIVFFIEPPRRDSPEDLADQAAGPTGPNLMEVARVDITPSARPKDNPEAHQVKITLNITSDETPCWTVRAEHSQ